MSKFRILFGLVAFAFVFSCKAPTTSTSSPITESTPPGTSVTIPDPGQGELALPIWWIEESYTTGGINGNGRPGSPTVVAFETDVNGWKVYARTRGSDRLQHVGTFGSNGGNTQISVPDLYFGVTEDGKWDKTVVYKGKKLVKGQADFGTQSLLRMMGTWSSVGSIDFPGLFPSGVPSNAVWKWEAELDGYGKMFAIVYQNPEYGTPIEGPSPMEIEKTTKDGGASRHYRVQVSDLGDYLYLLKEEKPSGVIPLYLSDHHMDIFTEFYDGATSFRLKSNKNAHIYYLEETGNVASNGRKMYKWKQLEKVNNGGKSGILTKKN